MEYIVAGGGLVLLNVFILWMRSRYLAGIVKKHSKMYNNLLAMKSLYNDDIKAEYAFFYHTDSKQKFDKLDFEDCFKSEIEKNIALFEQLVKNIRDNRIVAAHYSKLKCENTREEIADWGMSFRTFSRIEKRLITKNYIHHPIVDASFVCEKIYRTPKGQKEYRDSKIFTFDEAAGCYDSIVKMIENKQTNGYLKKVERSKMSYSLRYDILKRDGATCQLCGASKEDGVKLHVDHITPVAKGGKTVRENLQTLCETCNLGKSDKI